jgi:hypothetical protein
LCDTDSAALPAGQPYCYGVPIAYKNLDNVRIQGCKAKIALKGDFDEPADDPTTGNSTLSTVIPFAIYDSSYFAVDGLEIYGGADLSSRDLNIGAPGAVGIITNGSHHYRLSNLNIHHMQMDGVLVGADVSQLDTDFTLDRIFSEHNARAALTVNYARHGKFTELDLGYTGCTGLDPRDLRTCSINDKYPGFDFKEGVDIEPDLVASEKTGDLTFDHVNIHDNLGFIFAARNGSQIEDITIQNSNLIAGKGASNGAAQVVMGVKGGLIKDSTIDLRGVDVLDGGRGEILNLFESKFKLGFPIIPNPDWSETKLTIQRTTVYASGTGIQSLIGNGTYFGPLIIEDSHFVGSQDLLPDFCGDFPDLKNPKATISNTIFEYPAVWSRGGCPEEPGRVGLLNIGSSTGNTFKRSKLAPGVTCIRYGGTATPTPAPPALPDNFPKASLQPCKEPPPIARP